MRTIKKRFATFLTVAACLTGSVSAMAVCAEDYGISYDKLKSVTIETNAFVYDAVIVLKDSEVDADWLVVGTSETSCFVIRLHSDSGQAAYDNLMVLRFPDGVSAEIGDLLKMEGDYVVLGTYPGQITPVSETEWNVTNVGKGSDLLGREFERVVRTKALLALEEYCMCFEGIEDIRQTYISINGIDKYFGDVNVDDVIDILDCITVNKQLLGSAPISDYTQIVGDVNGDGVLDSTDSLAILKEVVGITEHFEEI